MGVETAIIHDAIDGFGYTGVGYEGGRWENGVFFYNRTVNNFGIITITNVYEKPIVIDVHTARVSFNGGSGGTTARPNREEEAAAREQRVAALPAQLQHERIASANKALLASENHGRPAIAATAKPGQFAGKGVVAARETEPVMAPAAKSAARPMISPNTAAPQNLENKNRGKEEERGVTQPGGGGTPLRPRETETEHPSKVMRPEAQSPPPPQAAVKPAPLPPPPQRPAQAEVRPVPTPQPPHPACPPGKRIVEVNGHGSVDDDQAFQLKKTKPRCHALPSFAHEKLLCLRRCIPVSEKDHQRHFERKSLTAALPGISDVLLARGKRRSGPL